MVAVSFTTQALKNLSSAAYAIMHAIATAIGHVAWKESAVLNMPCKICDSCEPWNYPSCCASITSGCGLQL